MCLADDHGGDYVIPCRRLSGYQKRLLLLLLVFHCSSLGQTRSRVLHVEVLLPYFCFFEIYIVVLGDRLLRLSFSICFKTNRFGTLDIMQLSEIGL